MTITFKAVDKPSPGIISGILDIEQEAFGEGALNEYVVVPLVRYGKVYIAADEDGDGWPAPTSCATWRTSPSLT